MSAARDLVYNFVNEMARLSRQAISRNPQGQAHYVAVEAGSDDDLYLHGLLNKVEDDRAHAEAQKLLDMHMEVLLMHGPQVAQGLALAIKHIDPYVRRDGQLVRKSDDKPVTT